MLRFDRKKWCFSRLPDSSSPLPFPDRSFFQQVQTLCVHTMTGPSHAACNIGRDLHFRLDRYRARCSPTVSLHYSEDLPLMINCCNCSPAGRAQRLEWVRRQLDPPATFSSRRFCLKTCSCRLTMKPLRGECPLILKRYVHDRREKFATPKSIFFTCPNISHIWKQEKPTTTTLNSKKER